MTSTKPDQSDKYYAQLFRFPPSKDITELIHYFAKVHQYDDRKSFKEAWKTWTECDEIKAQIDKENARLQKQGFAEDINKKLFVSARYYYRTLQESDQPTTRRKEYSTLSKDFLKTMDQWITNNSSSSSSSINRINRIESPDKQYVQYCKENIAYLQREIEILKNKSTEPLDVKEIDHKFRKTFSNREYVLRTRSDKK